MAAHSAQGLGSCALYLQPSRLLVCLLHQLIRGGDTGTTCHGGCAKRGMGRAGQRNPRPAPGRGLPPRFDEPEDIEFVRILRGHTKQVTAAALDPTGQTLYTGSQDGTVRCWSTATAQVRLALLFSPYLLLSSAREDIVFKRFLFFCLEKRSYKSSFFFSIA